MISYIKADIYSVTSYLPVGIAIGTFLMCICALSQILRKKSIQGKYLLVIFLFMTYVVIMLEVALLSREPGSRDSIDLIPFSTWGNTLQSKAYVIENGIMFFPYGILLPLIWKSTRKFGNFLTAVLGSSVALEGIQLLTKRGYCQIDDVILNVLGGILGFIIIRVVMSIWFKST